MSGQRSRAIVGAVLATAAAVAVYVTPLWLDDESVAYWWVGVLGGTTSMLLAWMAFKALDSRTVVVVILAGAAMLRILLVPTTPTLSTDLYRYLWDGRVQAAGVNPYLHAPAADAVEDLEIEGVSSKINRRDERTIYPGGAQLTFATTWRAGVHRPVMWKALMAAVDLLSVVLLVRLLRRRGGDRVRHAVLYAWNPLTLLGFAHSGHVDSLVVLALVGAVALWQAGSRWRTGLMVGAAAAVKLYPIALVPAIVRDRDGNWDWRAPVAAVGVLVASYLPYLGARSGVLGYLTSGYLTEEGYESGRRFALAEFLHVPGLAVAAVLLGIAVVAALRSRRGAASRATWILGAALAATTPYPWYATALVAVSVAAGSGLPGEASWRHLLWPLFAVGLYVRYVGHRVDPIGQRTDLQGMNAVLAGIAILVVAGLVFAERSRRRAHETSDPDAASALEAEAVVS